LLERIDPLRTDDDLTGGSGFGGALVGAIGSRHFLLLKAWMQGEWGYVYVADIHGFCSWWIVDFG